MKILKVSGDDYGALNFVDAHGGTSVKDIIDNIGDFEPKDDEEFWELQVKEIEGDIPSKEFISFVKGEIDYDHSKHEMWYIETETI